MAITTTPYISKSGQVAFFFPLNTATPPVLQSVSQIAANPTILVNGSTIQFQGPYWMQTVGPPSNLMPMIAYQVSCGPVQSIVVQKGGSGYTAPSAAATGGGGGSGCVLGTPVMAAGVITSIPVTTPGSGYTSPPAIVITDAAGSGAVAVPVMAGVQPGDTVTYSAAANWFTAGGFGAPAATVATVANYSGQLEPGLGGAVDFDMPAGQRALKAGFVLAWPHEQATMNFSASKNWIHRGDNWTNAVTSAIDGHPLTITGTASTLFDDPSTANGVDARNWPSQTGTWTFIADDTAPGALMTASLTCNTRGTVTALGTAGLVDGGSLVGGVQVGRAWQWDVERVASPTLHNLGLKLNVTRTGAVGTYNWTLTNEALFSPLATLAASPGGGAPYPSRANMLGPDQSMVNWLTTPRPRYAASIRYECATGYGHASSIVDASDLRGGTDFSWNTTATPATRPTGRRNIAISAVRTYATTSSGWPAGWAAGPVTWSSPNVYLGGWSTLPGKGVSSITITSGGSGYTNPSATVTGGGGSGCVLGVPVKAAGVITSIPVKAGGSGYTSPPTVVITDPNGINAAATAVTITLTQGVGATLVDYGGTGYTSPAAAATGGGGSGCVLATPTMSGGIITSIPVTTPGSGYTTAPTITITDPTGAGAIATALAAFTPADCGWLNASGDGSQWYVGEFVTATPHNLKTGQLLNFVAGNTTFQVSNGSAAVITTSLAGLPSNANALIGWVTSPTTIAFTSFTPAITAGSAATMPGRTNNVAGTFAVSYTILITSPPLAATPPEVNAAISGSFPLCNHFVNVPHGATDLCCAEIARRVRDNLPKGRQVFVEYSNEDWNYPTSLYFTNGMGKLNAWGSALSSHTIAYTTRAWQHHETFINVFNQADINGNTNRGGEIVRLFGSQGAGSAITQIIVNYANSYNSGHPAVPLIIDAFCLNPYVDMASQTRPNPGTVATVNPTGGGAAGGLLAAGTYFASYTWIDSLTGLETAVGAATSAQFTVAVGNIPRVTIAFPAGFNWTASANIYLTPAGGAAGTLLQYATGVTGVTTDLAAANTGTVAPPASTRLPSMLQACHSLASGHTTSLAYLSPAPWTRKAVLDCFRHQIKYSVQINSAFGRNNAHLAALATYVDPFGRGVTPYLIGYEGGIQGICPAAGALAVPESDGRYLDNKINHDLYYDPELYYSEMAIFQMAQQGTLKTLHVYSLCMPLTGLGQSETSNSALWGTTTWPGQPAGRGDGTGTTTDGTIGPAGTAVTNQFWMDDGKAHHLDNVSVRLQAWRDWADDANLLAAAPLRGSQASRPLTGNQLWTMHG